jgi:eukaryotic-like serine/threonine-protein kinase
MISCLSWQYCAERLISGSCPYGLIVSATYLFIVLLALRMRRCLEKDPNERFQSARDLGFALEAVAGTTGSIPEQAVRPKRSKLKRLSIWVVGFLVLVASYLVGHRAGVGTAVQSPVFTPQTFQCGVVHTARFAPDGQTIVYSAEWGGDRSFS